MNTKQSAGIILYRQTFNGVEFLLVHPGGPFFHNKDLGEWSIPKGQIESGEDIESAARREFAEETGIPLTASLTPLTSLVLKSGKRIHAFMANQDADPRFFTSNTFELNGKHYPEIDKVEWFPVDLALQKIKPSQQPFLHQILSLTGHQTQ